MDPIDPNKTVIPQSGDLDRTQIQSVSGDSNRTQMAGPPGGFTLTCRVENGALSAGDTSRNHLLVQWRASGNANTGTRMPLNLALAIDRSGSMEGEPLQYAQRACCHIIDLLDANDVLSIVTFAEDVQVLVPARRVVNRELLKEHINRIVVGNTTDLHGGMTMAANQAASVAGSGYVNRVLLLSDGEPTVGLKDYQSITGAVEEQKSRGITITALGFGPDYNEELLAGIAKRSGGNYYYITRPDLIPEVFRSELMTLMRLVARDARLRIRPARWNRVRQIYGHKLAFTSDAIETPISDLEQGNAVTLLVEMDFGPRPTGEYRCAQVEVEFESTASGRVERLSADAVWKFTGDPAEVAGSADPGVAAELEVAMAAQAIERTLMGIKTQQLDARTAMLDLERTQQLLAAGGRLSAAADVTQALDNLRSGDANAAGKSLIGTSLDLQRGKSGPADE